MQGHLRGCAKVVRADFVEVTKSFCQYELLYGRGP